MPGADPAGTAAATAAPPKPLRADAQRNRERILVAAEAVIATEGIAVPVDAVAREAGLGVGTLYRHFPTKEALLAAIYVSRIERLVDDARSKADAANAGEALHDFLARIVEVAADKKDLGDALTRAGIDVESTCRDELMAAVGVLLDRAQRDGTVRADVGMPELVGLVGGTCMAADRLSGSCSRERLLAIVWDGLRARR